MSKRVDSQPKTTGGNPFGPDVFVGLGQLEREIRNRRASEFSFGPGLCPPAFAGNDPAHGGRYQPFPPAVAPKGSAGATIWGRRPGSWR